MRRARLLPLAVLLLLACSGTDAPDSRGDGGNDAGNHDTPHEFELASDFEADTDGWSADFADLPHPPHESYELDSGLRSLPAPLPSGQRGFFLQGHNRSDDLLMVLTRRVGRAEGLVPGQAYRVAFAFKLATSAAGGCMGAGGAPAEAVRLKVGASPSPAVVTVENGRRVFSLDIGDQSQIGADAAEAGNIASGRECGDKTWTLVERAAEHGPVVASAEGELSVFVGTDSGYEGFTSIYYDSIEVTFTPVAP